MAGIAFTGSCCVLFGTLDKIQDPETFIVYCFLTRTLEAVGYAAYQTATFTLISIWFPNNIGTVLSITEILVAAGLSAGPAIGSIFYEIGGYSLPFYVLGGFMLSNVLVAFLVLPPEDSFDAPSDNSTEEHPGLWDIMRIPSAIFVSASITMGALVYAALLPTLQPHTEKIGVSPSGTGLMFFVQMGFYALSGPLGGYLTDHDTKNRRLTLTLDYICNVIIGITYGFVTVPTFGAFYQVAQEVLGPAVGGFLTATYGFPTAMTTVGTASITLGIAMICFHFYWIRRKKPTQPSITGPMETTPLLAPPKLNGFGKSENMAMVNGSTL
ncbi:unnamed protein product [Cyprideis torosa]|uniref:Uncharacterized protein n=1 Tax=Cyprideis torosa TaxID=163714 RepID=A0A7R8W514_9CRUS|nr:unnamed protein product [Cyprideis torosa]CAG0881230.1 unnamed protein product [Cyprideis torosa]